MARRLGLRSVKQLKEMTTAYGRPRMSKGKARQARQSRKRRESSKRQAPTLEMALRHFVSVLPESVACPRKVCSAVYDKHKQLGILPKSPADLAFIFQTSPREAEGFNGHCWVCLYRAYRDLHYRRTGSYPGPDVPDNFAQQFQAVSGTAGQFTGPQKDIFEGSFDYSASSGGSWTPSQERTKGGRRRWSLSSSAADSPPQKPLPPTPDQSSLVQRLASLLPSPPASDDEQEKVRQARLARFDTSSEQGEVTDEDKALAQLFSDDDEYSTMSG